MMMMMMMMATMMIILPVNVDDVKIYASQLFPS